MAEAGQETLGVQFGECSGGAAVALCYGWIDGQGAPLDDGWWLQRYTPRTRRSKWSQKNRDAVLALIEAGEMKPAGLAEVEAAREDGRWAGAYASPQCCWLAKRSTEGRWARNALAGS